MEKEKTGNGENKGDKRSEPEGRRGQKYHRLQPGAGLALEGKKVLMLNVDHKCRKSNMREETFQIIKTFPKQIQ